MVSAGAFAEHMESVESGRKSTEESGGAIRVLSRMAVSSSSLERTPAICENSL